MGSRLVPFGRTAARDEAVCLLLVVACVAAMLGAPAAGSSEDPVLKPGDAAPDFTLPGSDGRTYRLADYRGVRPVVLAWFPRAFAKE